MTYIFLSLSHNNTWFWLLLLFNGRSVISCSRRLPTTRATFYM